MGKNYPGHLSVKFDLYLSEENELIIEYQASSSETPLQI
jgi:galactose mutarotase-like enzyme